MRRQGEGSGWIDTFFTHSLQNCDSVVDAIKETGQIKREQRDLEEQVSNSQLDLEPPI